MTAADWLLETLANEGVEVMFGNPGSTELPLVDAFPRQRRIRYVLGLHEAAVMGMADGYAQQGDQLAVVNVHVQPGLANAMSGILNAARARVPMLVTVGQQVTELKDRAPFLGGELVRLAKPIAKAAWEVGSVDDLVARVPQALLEARAHPRGPVVLSLPMDVLTAGLPEEGPGFSVANPGWDPDVVDAAMDLLVVAERPAVLAGDGVLHESATMLVSAIAERLGAPIYGEPFAARVPVETVHPLWRGPLPGFASEIRSRLEEHDVLLAVGMPVFRLFGASSGSALTGDQRLIHVDVDEAEVGRTYEPAVGIVAPVGPVLEEIAARLPNPPSRTVADRRRRVENHTAGEWRAAAERFAAEASGAAIGPAALCAAVGGAVEPDDLVVDEALTAGRWLRTVMRQRNSPANWLAHRGSALGWGLPAAVGAKLADPARRVLCVHGDGSFLFGVHALWTAARERLGLAVVVADNGGYEILRAGLEGLTGRPEDRWPGLWLDRPSLDLVAIARGFGASAERLDDDGQLADALSDNWQRAKRGPAVLVVPVTGRTPAVGYPV